MPPGVPLPPSNVLDSWIQSQNLDLHLDFATPSTATSVPEDGRENIMSNNVLWTEHVGIDDPAIHKITECYSEDDDEYIDQSYLMAIDVQQILAPSTDIYNDLTMDLESVTNDNETVLITHEPPLLT